MGSLAAGPVRVPVRESTLEVEKTNFFYFLFSSENWIKKIYLSFNFVWEYFVLLWPGKGAVALSVIGV